MFSHTKWVGIHLISRSGPRISDLCHQLRAKFTRVFLIYRLGQKRSILWIANINGYPVLAILLWIAKKKQVLKPLLTLTLPGPSAGVSGSLDSYCSLKPLCSGMGEVVPARTSPTLLPPSPRTVLSLSCFKVSQCINCRDWHCKS